MLLRAAYFLFKAYVRIFHPILFGVRVVLVKEEQALLVKHTYKGGWHLPGGGIERNETIPDAARRELREETGLEAAELKWVGVYSSVEEGASGHNFLFACEQFKKVGKPDHEIAEARFFPLDALPEGLLPGHRRRLEEYRAGVKSPPFGEW